MVIRSPRHTKKVLKSRRSNKQDGHNIHVIIKTMLSPSSHHNGNVAAHGLRHMMLHIVVTNEHSDMPLMLRSFFSLLSTLLFIGTSNV